MATDNLDRRFIDRSSYVDTRQRPSIFYAVFGFDGELVVSKAKHNVTKIPDGLDIIQYSRSDNSAYIDGFLDQYLGKFLDEKGPDFSRKVRQASMVTVLRGELAEDRTLAYLQNVVGLIQSMFDQNAIGALDLFALKWLDKDDWHGEYFQDFGAKIRRHVAILLSAEANDNWLHTRGLIKFGRPDLSIHGVPEGALLAGESVVNRLIGLHIDGGILESGREILLEGVPPGLVFSFVDEPDNPDFNNVYMEAAWPIVP